MSPVVYYRQLQGSTLILILARKNPFMRFESPLQTLFDSRDAAVA
jgi:hypothetical protein